MLASLQHHLCCSGYGLCGQARGEIARQSHPNTAITEGFDHQVHALQVEAFTAELKAAGAERVFPISGATGKGMDALLDAVLEYLPAATVTERPDGEQEEGEEQPWSPV